MLTKPILGLKMKFGYLDILGPKNITFKRQHPIFRTKNEIWIFLWTFL